jgi:hypothetical protein
MSCMSQTESAFSAATREFLTRVEYRSPADASEWDLIFRMRYAAYLREGALPPGAPEIFRDAYDESPNVITHALYVDGQLASSIRFHLLSSEQTEAPAMTVFKDKLQPLIDAGAKIIDPTRFVVEETAARLYPKMPYATLRIPTMASEYYDADYVLATVRTEHQPFYKRLFGHKLLCEARPYPLLAKPISLMLLDYKKTRSSFLARYPFLRSTEEERRRTFERGSAALLPPAPIV